MLMLGLMIMCMGAGVTTIHSRARAATSNACEVAPVEDHAGEGIGQHRAWGGKFNMPQAIAIQSKRKSAWAREVKAAAKVASSGREGSEGEEVQGLGRRQKEGRGKRHWAGRGRDYKRNMRWRNSPKVVCGTFRRGAAKARESISITVQPSIARISVCRPAIERETSAVRPCLCAHAM